MALDVLDASITSKIDGHKLTEEHFAKIKSESTQKVPATR